MEPVTQVRFGVMSPTLAEQFAECEYDAIEMDRCQRLADAISDLWVGSILSDTEVKSTRKRLGKRIFKAVNN